MRDLRTVPAAAATWLACGLAVGADPGRVAVAAGVTAVLAALALAIPADVRALPALALVLVCVAAALAGTAARLHVRDTAPLPDLVAERATASVVGVVRSEPVPTPGAFEPDRLRVVVHLVEVSGRGRTGRAAAPVVVLGGPEWGEVRYGARVATTGRLAPTDRGDVAVALLVAGDPVEVAPPGAVDRAVGTLRDALLQVTDPLPPDLRGLVPGAAVGDTSRVPPDLEVAMRETGLTHITAVSGGHVAVLGVCVLGAAAFAPGGRRSRAVVLGLVLVGFVQLVHPEPSVVRAAAMGAVTVVALAAGRPAQALPALAGAVVVLCLVDPWLARSYGFALSVLATAAIVTGARPLAELLTARVLDGRGRAGQGRAGRVRERVALVVAVPVCAQAVCAPVLILLQPEVSLVAVPANVLAAPAVLPATLFGVLATVVAPWAPAVAEVVVMPAAAAAWWIAVVARALAGLPGATLPWPDGVPGAALLLLVTVLMAVLLVLVAWFGTPRVRSLTAVVVTGALVLQTLHPGLAVRARGWPPGDWDVVACDVGQGDALVVRSGPGAAVVVDVGPPDGGVGACLTGLGVRRIDLLVLTHHHADHVGGLGEALAGRRVERVLVSPLTPADSRSGTVLDEVHRAATDVAVGAAGMTGRAGAVQWEVLWPSDGMPREVSGDTPGSTLNDASVVLAIRTPRTTVVALGDVEPPAQAALHRRLTESGALRHVDVLKVAHHGSARQDARLVEWLSPTVALVSAGEDNHYGHPAPSAVALHEAAGALVLSTHTCGPVAVAGGGDEVRVWADCLDR